MDTALAIALIAGAVSLVSAAFTGVTTASRSRADREYKAKTDAELEQLRHNLAANVRREDRSLRTKEVLDQYRRPLLAASVQLARRIENIVHRSFLEYLKADEHRAQVALRSILYRFAVYMGWRELLNRELTYLSFEDSAQTREVLGLLDDLRAKMSSSRFDIVDGLPKMMLWTDEQAAIGGLMQTTGNTPGVIGFETFYDEYEVKFAPWLDSFALDLQREDVINSTRLREVAAVLEQLIRTLDVEGVYGDHPEHPGGWRRQDASRESAGTG
jgi:hypothetical protein